MNIISLVHADLHAIVDHMVAIQVRDVPESVRDDLVRAARERGQSLQAFLADVLETEARKSRNRELLRTMTPIPVLGGAAPGEISELIRRGHEGRDAQIIDTVTRPDQP
ncbi:hypothetical protein ACFY5A_10215 [Microbacterium sp. NPDC012755]|uniref:hypothetical protein n=1 Tax=Microbacterium sp. NPDC012755 TaxID=3364184 RepID=UPI003678ACAB